MVKLLDIFLLVDAFAIFIIFVAWEAEIKARRKRQGAHLPGADSS